jgi:DNA-binding CsgD family transcriptional regulator
LAQLSRLPAFRRHTLDGLDIEDVQRFFLAEAGQDPDAALVQSLHSHTEGNPFFLGEVIRLLASSGGIGAEGDGDLGLPQGVRDVIGQRLRRLSDQCNQVLTTASVVGREFDFRMLGTVMEDISEIDLLDVVDEALEAHLVEAASGLGDRYQFTHALVQQTLSETLSTSRRVRLHARIGEVLETMYAGRLENRAAELAHHFSQAAPVLGTEKLVHYALLAGERALAAFAHEEALEHFTQGLVAKQIAVDDDTPAPDEETARLLFGIGRAQAAILRRGAAQNLNRAFDYYALAGDVPKAVEVARFPMAPGLGRIRVTGLLSKALELVPPNSRDAASLLSRYGWALGQEVGDYGRAMTALNQALSIAQEQDDPALELLTRANSADVNFFNLRLNEVLGDARRMAELFEQVNSPQAQAVYRTSALLAANFSGDLEAVARYRATSISVAESSRDSLLLAGALFVNSGISYVRGDWSDVRGFTDRGLAINQTHQALLLSRTLCEFETGEFGQGDIYLDRMIETARNGRHAPSLEISVACYGIPFLAEITGSNEHLEEARMGSEIVLSYQSASPFAAQMARTGLVVGQLLSGELSGIEVHYEALRPYAGIWPAWAGVDRVLGQICRATGQLDQAVEHFQSAIDFCHKSSYRSQLARVALNYAGTLLERNGAGDREHARALADEGLAAADELGMGPLMEQLVQLQVQIAGLPEAAASNPGGLTQREADVIRLIAAGKTDREIAEELIIAIRTVTTHVGNILNKTGAANRAEAASFATRHGLD